MPKPAEVRKRAEKVVERHMLRHGVTDPFQISEAKEILMNVLRRETQFRNVTNDRDRTFGGKPQVVYGYAQYRADTFQEMLKAYVKADAGKVPLYIRNRCEQEWRSPEFGLECEVEVMSFAYRKTLSGQSHWMQRWSTYPLALADREMLAMQ